MAPFALAECLLRFFGGGVPDSYGDPYIAFSDSFSLFEHDSTADVYRIAKHHHYFFGQQEFPGTKSSDSFRVFCLGGSTVLGHPYDTPTSFAKWLELELNARTQNRKHEVVNCGGMSYASYRLIPILEEVLNHDPDLIVVMTGHNEFLEDRTYDHIKSRSLIQQYIDEAAGNSRIVTLGRRLLSSPDAQGAANDNKTELGQAVDAKLDHASGYASYRRDDQWWNDVAKHHALNLRVMVEKCRRARVPLLLINPGSNLRDCPPFKAENRADLSANAQAKWQRLFESGEKLEVQRPGEALSIYLQANEIDDQHAQLAYRIARTLDAVGRPSEALPFYVRAKELDICPLRMLDVMEQNLFDIAERSSTPVIDARKVLQASESPYELVGYDWYVDHVHPTIRGHQLIAATIVQQLSASGIVQSLAPWNESERRAVYKQHLSNLGEHYLQQGRRRVEWLERWGRRERSRDDSALDNRTAFEYGNLALAFGEYATAESVFDLVGRSDEQCTELMLERALRLFHGGQSRAAATLVSNLEDRGDEGPMVDEIRAAMLVLAIDRNDQESADELADSLRLNDTPQLSGTSVKWLSLVPSLSTTWPATDSTDATDVRANE